MDTNKSIVQNDDVKDDSKGSIPPQFIENGPICKGDGSKNDSIVQNDDDLQVGQGDSDVNSENAAPMLPLGWGGGSESYPERPDYSDEEVKQQCADGVESLRNDLFKWSTFDPRRRDFIVPNDNGSQVEQGDSGGGGRIARQIIGNSNRASSDASLSTPRSHHLPNNSQQVDSDVNNENAEFDDFDEFDDSDDDGDEVIVVADSVEPQGFKMSTFRPPHRDTNVPNDNGSQVEQGDSGGGGSIARQIIGDSNRASSEASLSTPRSHHLPNNSQQVARIESLQVQLAQREQVIQQMKAQINALRQTNSSGTSIAGQNHRKRWSKLKVWRLLTKKKQPRDTKDPNDHGS